MRLITWNINSVRLRLDLLAALLDEQRPDVFCLQETKTPDEFFPVEALRAKGFVHHHFAGIKGYNGVAVFSKLPLSEPQVYQRCGKDDCRHISVKVRAKEKEKAFELHNIYIPAGGYEPDPVTNEKFRHKLDFVDELAEWFSRERSPRRTMITVGDLNIAPLENDVWDHEKMIDVVSHTPVEIEKFAKFYRSVGWVDAIRHFVPEEKKLYSWWSYRAPDWEEADRGRRLDHVWVTKDLKAALKRQKVLREMRGRERPSDHVPIVLDLEL